MSIAFRYPGSKQRIAPWVLQYMPEHHSYLEPYFGCGAVLFNKHPSKIETINDLDDEVVNFFKVLRDQTEELIEKVLFTPYARMEYEESHVVDPETLTSVERARNFLLRTGMSYGYRLNEKVGFRRDIAGREAAYTVKQWNKLPQIIAEAAERLKMVQIEHKPAIELIKEFNNRKVLIYADPPYVFRTRSQMQYPHEMSDEDHMEMCLTLLEHNGPVMLSGYENEIYNDLLHGWRKESIKARAEGNKERTECLWMNYNYGQQSLF